MPLLYRFTSSKRLSVGFFAIGVWVTLLSVQPLSAHESHRPAQNQPEPRYSRTINTYRPPNVTLVNTTGARVPLVSILNQPGPLLLQFIFTTCPAVCPVLSSTFSAVQDRLPRQSNQPRLISISIDPEHDTPQRLQTYADKLHAKPHWQFLTGKLDDIVAVQKAFDAYRGNKMRHLPATYLRASPTDPWVRLNGFMSVADLIAEYRLLVAP